MRSRVTTRLPCAFFCAPCIGLVLPQICRYSPVCPQSKRPLLCPLPLPCSRGPLQSVRCGCGPAPCGWGSSVCLPWNASERTRPGSMRRGLPRSMPRPRAPDALRRPAIPACPLAPWPGAAGNKQCLVAVTVSSSGQTVGGNASVTYLVRGERAGPCEPDIKRPGKVLLLVCPPSFAPRGLLCESTDPDIRCRRLSCPLRASPRHTAAGAPGPSPVWRAVQGGPHLPRHRGPGCFQLELRQPSVHLHGGRAVAAAFPWPGPVAGLPYPVVEGRPKHRLDRGRPPGGAPPSLGMDGRPPAPAMMRTPLSSPTLIPAAVEHRVRGGRGRQRVRPGGGHHRGQRTHRHDQPLPADGVHHQVSGLMPLDACPRRGGCTACRRRV
jgi:hypothetical protein